MTVSRSGSYYISRVSNACESTRAEVKVTVGLSGLTIANTFSPNNDGINDEWHISDIENYPNASVEVYSRSGQKVFESNDYAKPFNGTYHGKELSAGTYFYILHFSGGCKMLSGNITILR